MTEQQAIETLARELKVSEGKALDWLEAAAEQLDQDGEDYTNEDCYRLARDLATGLREQPDEEG